MGVQVWGTGACIQKWFKTGARSCPLDRRAFTLITLPPKKKKEEEKKLRTLSLADVHEERFLVNRPLASGS